MQPILPGYLRVGHDYCAVPELSRKSDATRRNPIVDRRYELVVG
jgi:hypothetical protein